MFGPVPQGPFLWLHPKPVPAPAKTDHAFAEALADWCRRDAVGVGRPSFVSAVTVAVKNFMCDRSGAAVEAARAKPIGDRHRV